MIRNQLHRIRSLFDKEKRKRYFELKRLSGLPRYTETKTDLPGFEITVPDGLSFSFMFREIFLEEIYRFHTGSQKPVIIDGGANIGLSAIYLAKLYPSARITAFEPDGHICSILRSNLKAAGLNHVEIIEKGLWNEETTLTFQSEGADGGAVVADDKSGENIITIQTTRLRDYLEQKVDFLKLDIEGAEYTVLEDCRDLLGNVQNIFVEYHSFQGHPQKLYRIITMLTESGFRLHVNSPGLSSKSPLDTIRVYNGMDMQLNIYGTRHPENLKVVKV